MFLLCVLLLFSISEFVLSDSSFLLFVSLNFSVSLLFVCPTESFFHLASVSEFVFLSVCLFCVF